MAWLDAAAESDPADDGGEGSTVAAAEAAVVVVLAGGIADSADAGDTAPPDEPDAFRRR